MQITTTMNEAEHFLKALFTEGTTAIEFRYINDAEGSDRRFHKLQDIERLEFPEDKNVYVGIFERGSKRDGSKANCQRTRALWADFDNTDWLAAEFRMNQAKLPQPSMIVDSGHGIHAYWLLDEPAGHEVEPVLKAIAQALGSDSRVAEIARPMRVPGTWNVKDTPVKSELIQHDNGQRFHLSDFEQMLGVKAEKPTERTQGAVQELAEVRFNGLNTMAGGVNKGERNFCTGRIVQTLRRLNYGRQEVFDIVLKWNSFCTPKKEIKEVKEDIRKVWFEFSKEERIRFDGKNFSDPRFQELSERFMDDNTIFFEVEETGAHHYDNELFHPEKFHKVNGLTFAVLSEIKLAEDRGIRREHIADNLRRDKTDKKLRDSLKLLQNMGYTEVKKKNRVNMYHLREKPNFRRGFSAVPKFLHRLFIAKDIKEHEYKLLLLLEHYAFDQKKEVYVGNQTLATRLKQTDRNVRNNIKRLEHKQYIKTEIKKGRRYIRLNYR